MYVSFPIIRCTWLLYLQVQSIDDIIIFTVPSGKLATFIKYAEKKNTSTLIILRLYCLCFYKLQQAKEQENNNGITKLDSLTPCQYFAGLPRVPQNCSFLLCILLTNFIKSSEVISRVQTRITLVSSSRFCSWLMTADLALKNLPQILHRVKVRTV